MNKFDDLLARIKLLMPTAAITTDMHHEIKHQSHWASVRVQHGLILIMWHPGKSFKILLEGDEEEHVDAQASYGENVSDCVDFIVKYVIRRNLV